METLTVAQRDTIRTAVNAGRVAHHTRARTILATGAGAAGANRRYVVLSNHAGLTPHGQFYYHHTGHEAPDRRIDMNQTPTREGDLEYAVDRQGRRQRLRTLQPTGAFKYTAAGNHFSRDDRWSMSFMSRSLSWAIDETEPNTHTRHTSPRRRWASVESW